MPSTRDTADPPYTDTPSRQPEHTFSRSAAAVTSMLPGQPTEMPLSTTTRNCVEFSRTLIEPFMAIFAEKVSFP